MFLLLEFIALLDNYSSEVGHKEEVTQEELIEQNDFLDACLGTSVMKECFKFLFEAKIVKKSLKEFKNLLSTIWFQMYNRNAKTGSVLYLN